MNPYYLFSLTPLSLLLYVNVGFSYMLDLKHETYLLAVINMAAFIFALNSTDGFKKLTNQPLDDSNMNLILHSFILFLISMTQSLFPFLRSILWLFAVPAIVCALKSRKLIMYLLVALYLAYNLLVNPTKMAALLIVLNLLITFEKYYISNKRQRFIFGIYLVLGILFLLFTFSFANKGGRYDANEGLDYYSGQGVVWNINNSLFMPYMYFCTAWTNLQHVMETQSSNTYGLWILKPLLGYFQLEDNFLKHYNLEAYSSFNTFTYITCGYKDFGFFGSMFHSFALGYFVKKIYSRYKLSQSPFDVANYVCVGLAVGEMFFSNHFFMLSYPFTIVIVTGVYRFIILLVK